MRDITKTIKEAVYSNALWSVSMFYETLKELEKIKVKISYWENEENWAIIFDKYSKVKGYIWKKYPLIVLDKETNIKTINTLKDISCINLLILNSIHEENLMITEKIEYLSIFENDEFNINSFTMEDLWFYTNSI